MKKGDILESGQWNHKRSLGQKQQWTMALQGG